VSVKFVNQGERWDYAICRINIAGKYPYAPAVELVDDFALLDDEPGLEAR
jgi:hypothetical protein